MLFNVAVKGKRKNKNYSIFLRKEEYQIIGHTTQFNHLDYYFLAHMHN